MKKLEDFTKDICYSDTSYHLLSTNYYTSSQKILYEGTLRKMLQSEVSPYSGLLVFSDTAATSMYEYGSYFPNTYAKHCYELKEENTILILLPLRWKTGRHIRMTVFP